MNKTEADISLEKRSWAGRRRATKPKAVGFPTGNLVDVYSLEPKRSLPLVVSPAVPELSLADWTRNNREFIEENLGKHGGLLFRGFGMKGLAEFQEYLDAASDELMYYMESATPRTQLSDRSTPRPSFLPTNR
jgi:hypothetical protein